jgi:putative intracellular protease/amidase
MQDLLQDPSVAAVLQHFHASGKPTALICHGPIALLAAMPGSGNFVQAMRSGSEHRSAGVKPEKSWPYAGYRMTIFSTSEEKIAEHAQLGGEVLFYPQDALRKAGGVVSVAAEWSSNVVHDRELITGQNPSSDDALVKELLAALEANGK